MFIPKKDRLAILSYLFKEGTLVTGKQLVEDKHPQIGVPQLYVVKLMQSLRSKNLVRERFNWQYLYYVLTDEGIEYLRSYLYLSEDIVPATLKKPAKSQPPSSLIRRGGDDEGRRGRGGFRGRGGYRGPREDGAPSRGGFEGRGRGRGGFEGRGRGASSE